MSFRKMTKELENAGHTPHCWARLQHGDGQCECGATLCADNALVEEDRFAVFKHVQAGHEVDCAKWQVINGQPCSCPLGAAPPPPVPRDPLAERMAAATAHMQAGHASKCATNLACGASMCVCGFDAMPHSTWLTDWQVVSWDVETTDLSPLRGRVVQLGASLFVGGKLVRRVTLLVNPQCPISPATSQIHGITDADVANSPVFKDAMELLWRDLNVDDSGILHVAHNADFDRSWLVAEHARAQLAAAWLLGDEPWVCTMVLAKAIKKARKYDKGFRLADLCEACKIPLDWKLHDAGDDAEAAGRLLHVLTRWLPNDLDKILELQDNWQKLNH